MTQHSAPNPLHHYLIAAIDEAIQAGISRKLIAEHLLRAALILLMHDNERQVTPAKSHEAMEDATRRVL